jgi:hypothetical protein
MPYREPSDEWKESSDWDDIVGWQGGYILGVGYCYTTQFQSFFKQNNKNYHFFQTKWGRCGTTFLFSALRPDSIIIPVAWGNASAVCQSTDILFRIWNNILQDLLRLKVKTMMIDFPAAWQRSDLSKNMGGIEKARIKIEERRKQYYDFVINPYKLVNNFEYIDLYDYVPYNSPLIYENTETSKIITHPSPWHISYSRALQKSGYEQQPSLIDIIGKYFLDFINNNYDKNKLISTIKKETI